MTEFAGKPLIAHQISHFHDLQLDDIIIIAGYHKEIVERYAKLNGLACVENFDYATTNMVYTLFTAEVHFSQGGDLIISYGDIVYEANIIPSLLDCPAAISVVVDLEWRKLWSLRMDDPLSDAETLKFNSEGKLLEIGERPNGYEDVQAQYLGLIKVRADHVEAFRAAYHSMDSDGEFDGKDYNNMYMTSFIQHLIDTNWDVQTVPIRGGWLEIDTLDDLHHYERLLASGELDDFIKL